MDGTSFTNAGVGTGGTGSLAKSISGKVADGYLVNATVFLDKNGNYQLDADEPSTTTDVNGAYTLNVDPADVGKYPIVALAIKGVTIDKDTNQTIANSYVLSMPKESVSDTIGNNFISPFTSILREIMATGIYTSTQQAMDALRTKIGLPAGTDVMADYIAANNTDMRTAAQNIATLMGNQMGQVLGTNGLTTTVDVNRYRGLMGTIFSNMSTVRGANAQTGMSNSSGTTPNSTGTMPNSIGTMPNSTGTMPNSTGTTPNSTGTMSNSTGTMSNSTGTMPNSTGTTPNSSNTMSNSSSTMSNLNNIVTTVLSNMPPTIVGQPYQNMSTAFKGKVGGTDAITGGMMGR